MALRFHPEARAELDSARRRYRLVNADTARPSPIAGAGRAIGRVGHKWRASRAQPSDRSDDQADCPDDAAGRPDDIAGLRTTQPGARTTQGTGLFNPVVADYGRDELSGIEGGGSDVDDGDGGGADPGDIDDAGGGWGAMG